MNFSGKSILRLFLILAVLLGLLGGYCILEKFSSEKVREFAQRYDHIINLDFDRALINPFDRSLYLWGVRCDFAIGSKCSAARVVVDKFDFEHDFPRFFKGRVEDAVVPVDFMNFGTYASFLKKMGYVELNFDLEADYIYEDRTRRLSVRKLDFNGKDTCSVSAGFDLGDMKLQNSLLGGLIGVRMLDGGLILQDRSLVGRVIDLYASDEKVDADEFRSGLLDGLLMRMQKARSIGNGYAENFYTGLAEFIQKPGKLVFRVDPSEPVPLLYMFMGRDFEELLKLYGVTVESVNS